MQIHRFIEHVGELELEADSEAGVFAQAATAFRELVDGTGVHGRPQRRTIDLAPEDDPPRLLADWIEELVFLAEVHAFVPRRVVELDVRGGGIHATVEGDHGRPRHLIKAVALEDLELCRRQGRWYGHVVLDV